MRGMGDTTAYLRRGIREIICLALFFFTFLACEYLFDVRIAEFVPSSEVVIYESIVVGASVIGFFVRPFLYYRLPQTIDATSDITGVLLVSALLLMITAVRFEVVIAGGLVACCALGYCGSTAHANLARRFAQTPCLARRRTFLCHGRSGTGDQPHGDACRYSSAGCSGRLCDRAGGVAPRCRRAKLRDESDPSFEPSVAGLSVDALEYGAKWQDDPKAKAAFRRAVVRLTVATAYLSGEFAALNAGLTTLHATGAVDLGDWPRLLLVVSSLVAGALFDLHGRSYMNIGMTCAAILSTLSFFVLIVDGNGGNELAATIIFYLGSGFFVVFFTTKYAAVSLYARWSYFWPCMGRVVNNVCSMFVTAPAVAIISSQNVLAAVGAALVMFVGIAITLLGQLGRRADDVVMQDGLPLATDDLGADLASACSDPEPVEAAELTPDERLDAFVATFGLTERERDILEVLVVSDQSVQDIATTLFLSRSTLYRHISSINKKAGTASRVALINFFWSWTPKD